LRREELDRFGGACRTHPEMSGMVETLFDRFFPRSSKSEGETRCLDDLLQENGFDAEQHERIRADLKRGLIGLAQNRLPASSVIEDVFAGDVVNACQPRDAKFLDLGREALAAGAVAVVASDRRCRSEPAALSPGGAQFTRFGSETSLRTSFPFS